MSQIELGILGNQEWCAFPNLNTPAIRARIDSGAQTSSIHASDIRTFKKEGEDWVKFEIHPLRKPEKVVISNEAKIIAVRKIKNTGGTSERRYVIKTPVVIGGETFDIEVTLANRNAMGFRMLLGREAMINRFIVNPAIQYAYGNYTKTEIKNIYKSTTNINSGLLQEKIGRNFVYTVPIQKGLS